MTPEEYRQAVRPYDTALRMVQDAIGELFGPAASIASDEALATPEERAEAIIEALKRVAGGDAGLLP